MHQGAEHSISILVGPADLLGWILAKTLGRPWGDAGEATEFCSSWDARDGVSDIETAAGPGGTMPDGLSRAMQLHLAERVSQTPY